jgi:hypothetical protein
VPCAFSSWFLIVIPAKAGIHGYISLSPWTPAFAGVTN